MLDFERVQAGETEKIEALSALATAIVREHFDPIIGKAQNDYMLALIFLSGGKYQTVQLAVTNFDSQRATNYPMLLSAIIVVLIPSIVVCCIMTDKLTAGITAGAVKG